MTESRLSGLSGLSDYLDHIQQAAIDVRAFVEGLGKDDFLADKRPQQAVIMMALERWM